MASKKNYQCLMIQTKDDRKFFTHEKNFPQLIEFSKTFGAEISVVKVKQANVLSLNELAPAFCDGSYEEPSDYDLIKVKIAEFKNIKPQAPSKRKHMLEIASQVRSYIITEFLSKNIVSLHRVAKKFKKFDLKLCTVCNHIRRVRDELEGEGYVIEKVGAGKYQIT
jgi:hypothetical protein